MLRRQEGGVQETGGEAVSQSREAGRLGPALGTGTGGLEQGRGPSTSQFPPSSGGLWPADLQIADRETGKTSKTLAWGSRRRNITRPRVCGVFHGAGRGCVFLTGAVREIPKPFRPDKGWRMGVSYAEAIVFTHRCLLSQKTCKCICFFIWGFPEVICLPPVGPPRPGGGCCLLLTPVSCWWRGCPEITHIGPPPPTQIGPPSAPQWPLGWRGRWTKLG